MSTARSGTARAVRRARYRDRRGRLTGSCSRIFSFAVPFRRCRLLVIVLAAWRDRHLPIAQYPISPRAGHGHRNLPRRDGRGAAETVAARSRSRSTAWRGCYTEFGRYFERPGHDDGDLRGRHDIDLAANNVPIECAWPASPARGCAPERRTVQKRSANFIQIITMTSPDGGTTKSSSRTTPR